MSRAVVALVVIIVAALVVVVLIADGSAGRRQPTPTPRPTPRPTPTLAGTPVPSATPTDTAVSAAAAVVPNRVAELATVTDGRVRAINVRQEQRVTADQVLIRLDSAPQEAALEVARLDVVRGEAMVERAQLQLDQLMPDATPADVEAAEAELRLAQAELAVLRSTLTAAEVALRQTELRAPFGATVASIAVAPGEQARAGEPIIVLADLSSWFIETTDLGELDVVRIAVGDRATVTFEALPGVVVGGAVERIQVRGTTEVGGVRFAVAVRPDEHHPELRWNMTAEVRIEPHR
jgi:RND family efflux transporter MFP subunit